MNTPLERFLEILEFHICDEPSNLARKIEGAIAEFRQDQKDVRAEAAER